MGRYDVIVVGAGIVGAASAYYLHKAGLRVLALDKNFPGCDTSSRGMGHLLIVDDSLAQMELTAMSLKCWEELFPSLPDSLEALTCGTTWVAMDEEEMNLAESKIEKYRGIGRKAELLSGSILKEREPNLSSKVAGGLYIPGDKVIYAPAAVNFLLREVDCKYPVEIDKIEEGLVRDKNGREYLGKHVIVATGNSLAGLPSRFSIVPKKGHLAITNICRNFCHSQLIELGYLKSAHSQSGSSVAFNVQPRKNGQLLIGSSREFCGTDNSLNLKQLKAMFQRALMYMPNLAKLKVLRVWTGFRPSTPDNLPLIGPMPGYDGVYVASGHEGTGITTCLATGKILKDLILGNAQSLDPVPYFPSRFMNEALA